MRRMARGEARAERVSRNSAVPEGPITGTPGMNLRESSLGVVSVWMNIDLVLGGLNCLFDILALEFGRKGDDEVARVNVERFAEE